MYDAFTAGAQRALNRAESLARARGGSTVEPIDLLAALAAEAESRAAELMVRFGLEPDRVLVALGLDAVRCDFRALGRRRRRSVRFRRGKRLADRPVGGPSRRSGRCQHAGKSRRAWREIGTEHLLAALIAESSSAAHRLVAADLELERLRDFLAETSAGAIGADPSD